MPIKLPISLISSLLLLPQASSGTAPVASDSCGVKRSVSCATCPSDSLQEIKRQIKLISDVDRARAKDLVQALKKNFATFTTRKKDSANYLKALKAVLAVTPTGSSVLECDSFHSEQGIKLSKVDFTFTESKTDVVTFHLIPDGSNTRNYRRSVIVPLQFSPTFVLASLVHELLHSCDSIKLITHADDAEQKDQYQMLAELRAYQIQLNFFEELAELAAEEVCNFTFKSNFLGLKSTTLGNYHKVLEQKMKEGSFVDFIFDSYGEFEVGHIYETTSNGQLRICKGSRVIKPSLRKLIDSETGLRLKTPADCSRTP